MLLPRSRGDDAVSCGSGADIAAGPRRGDRLSADCEELRFSYGEEGLDQVATSAYPIQVSPASAVWLVGCPSFEDLDGESRAITATVGLREASGRGRLLGAGRSRVERGAAAPTSRALGGSASRYG